MVMGIFCVPRTVQHQSCLYRAAVWRHSQDSKAQMEKEYAGYSRFYQSGLYPGGLNPVYMKWNICINLSIYIYMYTYMQLRFNFMATANYLFCEFLNSV